jgi:hypothetical protein
MDRVLLKRDLGVPYFTSSWLALFFLHESLAVYYQAFLDFLFY